MPDETEIGRGQGERRQALRDSADEIDAAILKIEAESMGEIARLVVESVRSIKGVTNTKTLACAEL